MLYNMNREKGSFKELYPPTNDVIFKMLFGQRKNERFLKDLLEGILKVKISSVEMDKEILLPERSGNKLSAIDVSARLENGTKINIEIQNTNYHNITKRMTYYLSKLYVRQLKVREAYNLLHKTIVIVITNFNCLEDIKEYHTVWRMRYDGDSTKKLDEQELHFIELPKFLNGDIDINDKLAQWLVFIDYSRKELLHMAEDKNAMIREAEAEYEYLTGDEAIEREAYLQDKYEHDISSLRSYERSEGERIGEKRGIKATKKEMALKMLKARININQIIEFTGLSKEEIDNLK